MICADMRRHTPAAHLRDGVGDQRSVGGAQTTTVRGEEARPPSDRQAGGPSHKAVRYFQSRIKSYVLHAHAVAVSVGTLGTNLSCFCSSGVDIS